MHRSGVPSARSTRWLQGQELARVAASPPPPPLALLALALLDVADTAHAQAGRHAPPNCPYHRSARGHQAACARQPTTMRAALVVMLSAALLGAAAGERTVCGAAACTRCRRGCFVRALRARFSHSQQLHPARACVAVTDLPPWRRAAAGREPSWYDCWCDGAPNCMCPSTDPPGGLSYDETPQFILFTHDDAITWTTDNRIRSVTDGPTNPNGCPTRATLFTSATNTDCGLAWSMWNDGYEIADHTQRHTAVRRGGGPRSGGMRAGTRLARWLAGCLPSHHRPLAPCLTLCSWAARPGSRRLRTPSCACAAGWPRSAACPRRPSRASGTRTCRRRR